MILIFFSVSQEELCFRCKLCMLEMISIWYRVKKSTKCIQIGLLTISSFSQRFVSTVNRSRIPKTPQPAISLSLNENKKSNLPCTRGITLKRVTSCEAHLRGLAPKQHSSEETSKRRRAFADILSDLIGLGIETQTSCTDSDVVNSCTNPPVIVKLCPPF